jgi:hypothetical protein
VDCLGGDACPVAEVGDATARLSSAPSTNEVDIEENCIESRGMFHLPFFAVLRAIEL